MVAFTIFGWPIYRYGIFYLITFFFGYSFLTYLPHSSFFDENRQETYPTLYYLLNKKLDDIFLVIFLGVILGGRLGHVFFYERNYYSAHLLEILSFHQGGMSFMGGIIGVIIGLIYLYKKFKLTIPEFMLFGDLVLLIVPFGSFLGRIGNFLNQELVGKPLDIINHGSEIFNTLGLTHVFPLVDNALRVNTNFMQSFLEGFVIFVLLWLVFKYIYMHKKTKGGLISGCYLLLYSVFRFFVEFYKDVPEYELHYGFTTSQYLMLIVFITGIYVLSLRTKL